MKAATAQDFAATSVKLLESMSPIAAAKLIAEEFNRAAGSQLLTVRAALPVYTDRELDELERTMTGARMEARMVHALLRKAAFTSHAQAITAGRQLSACYKTARSRGVRAYVIAPRKASA